MIAIKTAAEAHELVALAVALQEDDEGLSFREAWDAACAELPALLADVQANARFVPAKVVWFEPDGRPSRVPNLLTPAELIEFTGGKRGH